MPECVGIRGGSGFVFRRVAILVLSRKKDEQIRIGDNIVITIVEIRGDKCRIGIQCERDIAVHRQEVWDAIQKEKADGE